MKKSVKLTMKLAALAVACGISSGASATTHTFGILANSNYTGVVLAGTTVQITCGIQFDVPLAPLAEGLVFQNSTVPSNHPGFSVTYAFNGATGAQVGSFQHATDSLVITVQSLLGNTNDVIVSTLLSNISGLPTIASCSTNQSPADTFAFLSYYL